jgi:hypothetical protein
MKAEYVGKCETLPEGFTNTFYLGLNVYKINAYAPARGNRGYNSYTDYQIDGCINDKTVRGEHCIIVWANKTRPEYVLNGNLS